MSIKANECKCVSCVGAGCTCGCQKKNAGAKAHATKGCACGDNCKCSPTCNCRVS